MIVKARDVKKLKSQIAGNWQEVAGNVQTKSSNQTRR